MIHKKELQKQIDNAKEELSKQKKNFNLLMNYLGLEIITEKSIETTREYSVGDLWGFPIGSGKEIDKIKYTDKIVKKTNKSKK